MKRQINRIGLRRETIRVLGGMELGIAVGGARAQSVATDEMNVCCVVTQGCYTRGVHCLTDPAP